MTAKKKIAQKRLTLLQLAEQLRNVSEACRLHRVSRSQFYEYKRSFQEFGLEGLVAKPPIPATHLTRSLKIPRRASSACLWSIQPSVSSALLISWPSKNSASVLPR